MVQEPEGRHTGLSFALYRYRDRSCVMEGAAGPWVPQPGWRRSFALIDFSTVSCSGEYYLSVTGAGEALQSPVFKIENGLLAESTISDILFYYKSQRSSWRWDQADRQVPFFGQRRDRVDASGGWYDASGDYSKYLSHLSYANYMNPQQIPLVVWSLLTLRDELGASSRYAGTLLEERALEEGLYGADFLLRMQDPEGYFYMTLFDQWSKDTGKRQITAFRGQDGELLEQYQAGFRQGGGMAIAALAKAARGPAAGASSKAGYLEAAEKGWAHLVEHNTSYLDNGSENIIDHYCALLAAVELYRATGKGPYLEAARGRGRELIQLYRRDEGYWTVEEGHIRPFFHASDAGLPLIALLEYARTERDSGDTRKAEEAEGTAVAAALDILSITEGSGDNPALLARQWVKPVDGPIKVSFFIPHENETGYWWQGENARLSSLACALRRVGGLLAVKEDEKLRRRLADCADAQLHWILGRNPYDICMLQGHGRNNPRYEDHYPNAPGGICNGITAGYADEEDIDFLPAALEGRGDHRWRWSEQWIPHAAWFLLALTADSEHWKEGA